MRKPHVTKDQPLQAKQVQIYSIGKAPTIMVAGKIEMPGIVQSINVQAGQEVGKGATVVSLSSNYQGGNAPDIQTQLAQSQLRNVQNTFTTQKEAIQKKRDAANGRRSAIFNSH